MKTDANSDNEQHFIHAADEVAFVDPELEPLLHQMRAWLVGVTKALEVNALSPAGLQNGSALAQQAQAIDTDMKHAAARWSNAWGRLAPARLLAQAFEEKVIFLVFGKFNAGKSSLCNFLAERFAQQGQDVQFFHLEAGEICAAPERFHEGATETTTRLQGVCLGEKLVLLDTPGLHSATAENAGLTQRFLDSADAVLWLTSSTSPGQVQELEELAQELQRNKPLLPVVTRSDYIDEDEVEGEIKKVLRNKTPANRALQEADVQVRAQEKLHTMGVDARLLRSAVSVSTHVARAHGRSAAAGAESGFERLYGALLALTKPALAYKQRKPAEVRMHYLEESVLGELKTRTMPALQSLKQALQEEELTLAQWQARMVQAAWRSVIPELAGLLERHAPSQAVCAVCKQLSQLAHAALEFQVQELLAGYKLPALTRMDIELGQGIGYESVDSCVSCEAQPASTADVIDYRRLCDALQEAVAKLLMESASQSIDQCRKILHSLNARVAHLTATLATQEHALLNIKAQLRRHS